MVIVTSHGGNSADKGHATASRLAAGFIALLGRVREMPRFDLPDRTF